MTTSDNDNPESLSTELAELGETGADRFDPVRFRFIDAMARRAREQRQRFRDIVEQKARLTLDNYRADLARARDKATATLKAINKEHPDSAEHAQELFSQYDFRALEQLAARLARRSPRTSLVEITRLLTPEQPVADRDSRGLALDEFLRQQEQATLQTLNDGPELPSTETSAPAELRSARLFRQLLAEQHADNLVDLAIEESPENPGPLNPQRLAIRSLTEMRDLSPHYLNRFVGYIDTLLWLEQAGERIKPAAAKKGGKSRAKKAKS